MTPFEKLTKAIQNYEVETKTWVVNIDVDRSDLGYAVIKLESKDHNYN